MKTKYLANFAIIFGALGFAGFLLMLLSGFIGCCAGISGELFNSIILLTLLLAVLAFAWCMYNNCCRATGKGKE